MRISFMLVYKYIAARRRSHEINSSDVVWMYGRAGGRTDASGLEPSHLDFFVYPSNDVSGGDRKRRESLETPTMSCI